MSYSNISSIKYIIRKFPVMAKLISSISTKPKRKASNLLLKPVTDSLALTSGGSEKEIPVMNYD